MSGLMGRIGKGNHGWTSRDYNINVPCNRVTCPANTGYIGKRSQNMCCMPSAIKINAAGLCQTGEDLIKSQPPEIPKKPDGD
jgi:hypothetical protein